MNRNEPVSDQLLALVYNVSLNDHNWWNSTIQSFILDHLFTVRSVQTSDALGALKSHQGLKHVQDFEIRRELESLLGDGKILQAENSYRMSETTRQFIELEAEKTKTLEKYFVDRVEALVLEKYLECADYCTPNTVNGFVSDMVMELGARVFNLVADAEHFEDTKTYDSFMKDIAAENRKATSGLLKDLLDIDDRNIRSLLFRKLNAFFCLKAGSLNKEDLEHLVRIKAQKPEFVIFIDTNFLFSLLGIHDNPANEVSSSLFSIIQSLTTEVKIKLYISQTTLREAVKVLDHSIEELSRIKFSGNVISSIQDSNFSGLMQKWLNVLAQAKSNLTVRDYFEPYQKNLVAIAREKGIELYNEKKIEEYSVDGRVLNDIAMQIEYEQHHNRRPKRYEQHVHDISLWYYTKDIRPSFFESVTDVKYWILTVDNRFIGYDAFRKKTDHLEYSICLHPAVFLSMLQFWVPKNDEIEKLLVEYVKQPTYFSTFDDRLERSAMKILQTLSRFQEMESLPEAVIKEMVQNDELKRRIGEAKSFDEEVKLIQDALLLEHARLKKEVESSKEKYEELNMVHIVAESELERQERRIRDLEDENERLREVEATTVRDARVLVETKKLRRRSWVHIGLAIFVATLSIASIVVVNNFLGADLLWKAIGTGLSIAIPVILSFFDRERLKKSFKVVTGNRAYLSEVKAQM